MAKDKEYLRISLGGYQGRMRREYAGTAFQINLETLFASDFTSQKALSAYPDRQVYRLNIPLPASNHAGSVKKIYIKRYRLTTLKQFFQTIFRVSKPQKSWRIGNVLLKKGVLTPRLVAYFARRTSLFSGEHILVTEEIPQGVSLQEYVRIYSQSSSENFPKRRLLQSVAEFLATLHQNGIYHGDFTANNIVVSPHQDDGVRIYLIDLDSVRSTYWISVRRCLKNLDELGRNFLDLRVITPSDRVRFLGYYLKVYPQKLTVRQLFNQVWERTQFRLKKHRQRFLQ